MIYGLLLEFESPQALLESARKIQKSEQKYYCDAFSPFPIEGLVEALGQDSGQLQRQIGVFALTGGILGAVGGFFMQTYATVIDYPIEVAGKSNFSWPAYIPVTFELTVLFSVLAAVMGFFFLNRLPQFGHPLFSVPIFNGASNDKFFILIKRTTGIIEKDEKLKILESLAPLKIMEIEQEIPYG